MFSKSKSAQDSKRTGTIGFLRRLGRTKDSLPKESEPSSSKAEDPKAPSYQFVSGQKGEVDDRAEDRGKKDEEIREEAGKKADDQEGPKTTFKKPEFKVRENEPDTRAATEAAISSNATFNRYWKLETDYDLEEEVHSETNYWIPNAIGLFEILKQSGRFAKDNRFMVKHHPEYLDYGVACYYSIIFYVQILRAQEAAGKLSGVDRSFMNRFTKRWKPEELPISSIFEPFLSTIVSSLIPDSQYGWIVPTYSADILQATVGTAFAARSGASYIQPMVPFMLRILRTAVTTEYEGDGTNADAYYDDDDNWIPMPIVQTADSQIFHNAIRIGVGAAHNVILYTCGMRYPFYADQQTLALAAPKWRKSQFRDFPYAIRIPTGAGQPERNRTSKGVLLTDGDNQRMAALDEFLCMSKESDVDWFNTLIDQASLHARFFSGVVSLSDIPTTSGFEPTIITQMNDMNGNNAITVRAPTHVGMPDAATPSVAVDITANAGATAERIRWYPPFMTSFRAGFATNRAGVEREQALQMITFGTNGTFSFEDPNHNLLGGDVANNRTGVFWQNKQWKYTLRWDLGRNGKRMFDNWSVMYQEDAAVIKPVGY